MYQKLEELLADVAIEAVHDKYRAEISAKAFKGLEVMIRKPTNVSTYTDSVMVKAESWKG